MRRTLALVLLLAGLLAPAGPAAGGDGPEVPPEPPRGDFNGDGYLDLAVGVPNEEVSGFSYAGAVNVLYGGPDGLGVEGNQLFDQSGAIYGDPQTGAMFGSALAVGDFDDDGFSDLAVGAPGYADLPALRGAGLIVVLYGSEDGLVADEGAFRLFFSRGARYGSTLAAGQFDFDGFDDLAVGAPRWRSPRARDVPQVGGVQVLYGSRFGLGRSQWWSGSVSAGNVFGSALAVGDFDDDFQDDLAIGVPGQGFTLGVDRAGVVHVLYGAPEGLSGKRRQIFSQASRGVGSSPEEGDAFGSSLAAGDFDRDLADDLAIGAPGEGDDRCSCPLAGVVHVLYGASGLETARPGLRGRGSETWRPAWPLTPTEFEFGAALAAGDFDHDLYADLAVGVPGWRADAEDRPFGLVQLLFGHPEAGLRQESGWELLAPGVQEATGFGRALAAADFDSDGVADLAVGAAGFDVDLKHGVIVAEDAGAVHVYYGAEDERPLPAARAQQWSQGELSLLDLLGASEPEDTFGAALGLPWRL